MQAIEFETNIEGEFIKIPPTKRLKAKHVRVIVLYHEEEGGQKPKLPEIFYTPKMRTQYEPFVREAPYDE